MARPPTADAVRDRASGLVALSSIEEAARRLPPEIKNSPLVPWEDGAWLKLENLQPTGSFKVRGALTKLGRLSPELRSRGVVAYSSGNHGLAVARAARLWEIGATVVVPADAPPSKLAAIASEGASLMRCAPGSEERRLIAEEIAETTGRILVPPYNDRDIIAGQGTIGLELVQQLPAMSSVIVPVGGGGLISGIASAVKGLRPAVRIIGVEPELAADAGESLTTGSIVEWSFDRVAQTVADGVRTQSVGELTFAHMRRFVDEMVTVTDEEILSAVVALLLRRRLVVEPAGAVAMAALLSEKARPDGAVVVISGGNTSVEMLMGLLRRIEDSDTSVLKDIVFEEPDRLLLSRDDIPVHFEGG